MAYVGWRGSPELTSCNQRELVDLVSADDRTLLLMARDGETEAIACLFTRYYEVGLRFARRIGFGVDSQDAVADTFARILDLLKRGKGPEESFCAYLLISLRNEASRNLNRRRRFVLVDFMDQLEALDRSAVEKLDVIERELVRGAYLSLPPRWRAVLWQLEVEGRNPCEVGTCHGISANAVSALASRARAGLRASYLQQHLDMSSTALSEECIAARGAMVRVIRGTAREFLSMRLNGHLASCEACDRGFRELVELDGQVG